MAENVMKSLLGRILAVPKGEPRSAQLQRVLRFFRWWLVTPFLAAYVLRQMRRAAKAAGLPRAPSIGTHWLLGAFEHIVWTCPRIPKTENRPDLMPAYQIAANETQAEGLFCMSFFHWLLPLYSNVVVVHDLELVRELLGKKSWELYRKGKSYRIATDLIGSRALLASPDCELWRWQRRLLSPSFRRHLFDSVLAPSVKRHVGEMCERWESLAAAQGQRPEVDLASEGLRLTLKVLGNFAFGYDFGSSDSGSSSSSEFALDEAFEVVLHRMTDFGRNPLLFATRLFPSVENRKYWRALKAIDQAALSSIDGRLAQAEVKQGDQSFGDDLLGHMLGASAADSAAGGHRMDRQLMLENLRTFLFAGHDTTASALTWALHLLATHPEEAAALQAELDAFGAQASGMSSAAAVAATGCNELDALPRLEAVLREVLRLYPSAGFTREPVADVKLGGHLMPQGTEIFVFPYLIHRDERLFPRAENFEPSRWLTPTGELNGGAAESLGWMPFSLGVRNCIGAQLAKLELKLALREFLARYNFTVPPVDCDGPPKVALYMTLVPNYVTVIPQPRYLKQGLDETYCI